MAQLLLKVREASSQGIMTTTVVIVGFYTGWFLDIAKIGRRVEVGIGVVAHFMARLGQGYECDCGK